MIPAVVSGLIYVKARIDMEIFSPAVRKLWKEWELRVLVLLSLVLQILLIFFGNRRKYSRRTWVRVLLWCAYLMADWVATVALGVLLNNMGDLYEDNKSKKPKLDADTQLTAFWAPFLLLHLGGPDTITAYSLEDNELWLRHFLGIGVQTGVALYIFLLAWSSSRFSILTMPMFLAGIIKYGERTWSLRTASNEQLRDSMITAPDPGPNYSKFMEEFTLKQCEGFYVVADEVVEGQVTVDVSSMGDISFEGATELLKAHYLFKTFKRLFVDLILSFQDRDNSQSLFGQISCQDAFKIVEIELGFMYDLLYTKGTIIYTRKGCWLRFITLATTCIVLVFFSLSSKHKCSKIDIAITFLLLVIAVLLELYAMLLQVSSDWTDLYLSKHKGVIRQVITPLQLRRRQRWSNSLPQYSLLSYCLTCQPMMIDSKIHKLFGIDKILEYQHVTWEEVTDELKDSIFQHLKKKFDNLMQTKSSTEEQKYQKELKDICMYRGSHALREFNQLLWSVEVEFDQSILIWHIATILMQSKENRQGEQQNEENKLTIKVDDQGRQGEQQNEVSSGQNEQKNEESIGQKEQKNEVLSMESEREQKTEVSSVQSEQKTEVSSLQSEHKNEVPSVQTEHKNEVSSVQSEQKTEVASVQSEKKTEVLSVQSEHKNEMSSVQNEQKTDVASVQNEEKNEVSSGQIEQKNEVSSVQNEQKTEVWSVQNEQKTEVWSVQNEQQNEVSSGQNEQQNEVLSGQNEQKPKVESVQSDHKNEVSSEQNQPKNGVLSGKNEQNNGKDFKKISKSLSQYMLYLLVMRPSMLPMGIGKIRYQDTCTEATKFFQEHESTASGIQKYNNISSWAINLFKKGTFDPYEIKACSALLNVNTVVPPVKVKGDRSKSVLFDACRLASDLQNIPKPNRWEVLSNVWVEMLAYAASHCRGTNHAQQLGRGGELLTHVWLLMAHFGLTEQFQISHGHARAKLSVK